MSNSTIEDAVDEQAGSQPEQFERRVSCAVCRESILYGARKCTHCDSFQDFRRWINISSSVLALLVALVSVLSVVLPDVVAFFEEEYSETRADLHAIENVLVNIVATNVGTKPSVFSRCDLILHNGEAEEFRATLEPQFATVIVYPGATQNVVFRLFPPDHAALADWAEANGEDATGQVVVSLREYGEKAKTLPSFDIDPTTLSRTFKILSDSRRYLQQPIPPFAPPPLR